MKEKLTYRERKKRELFIRTVNRPVAKNNCRKPTLGRVRQTILLKDVYGNFTGKTKTISHVTRKPIY